MKLVNFSLKQLRNEEHLQYVTDIDRHLEGVDLEDLMVDSFYPVFKLSWEKEKALMEYVRKSQYTTTIRNEFLLRNRMFSSFKSAVKVLLTPGTDPLKQRHAQNINRIVQHYRKAYSKMTTEKNATFRKFIYDLKADCAADLLALSLKSHIDELESVCTSVESSMDNRQFNIGLRNADLSVAEARNAVDTHFLTLITVLAAALTIKPTPANLEFAAKFNGLASLYRNTLKARISARLRAKDAKEDEVVQDSDSENMPASGQDEASNTL